MTTRSTAKKVPAKTAAVPRETRRAKPDMQAKGVYEPCGDGLSEDSLVQRDAALAKKQARKATRRAK